MQIMNTAKRHRSAIIGISLASIFVVVIVVTVAQPTIPGMGEPPHVTSIENASMFNYYLSPLDHEKFDFSDVYQLVVNDSNGQTTGYGCYRIVYTDARIATELNEETVYLSNGTARMFYGFNKLEGGNHYLFKIGDKWYMNHAAANINLYPPETMIAAILEAVA